MRLTLYFLLSVLIVLFLGGESSHAQTVPLLLKGRTVAPPTGYTGPGDTVSWLVAGGCSMAYSATTRGQAVCNICNAGDANCVDMVTDAITGIGVVPSPGGSVCNDSTNICTVKIIYDKSGNASDWTASGGVASRRPVLKVACGFSNGAPCFHYDGSSDLNYMTTAGPPSGSPASWSALAISKRTGAFTSQGEFLSNSPGSLIVLGFASSADTYEVNAGFSQTVAAPDNVWHTFQAVNTSATLAMDATQTTFGTLGGSAWDHSVKIGSICAFCNGSLTGDVAFAGVSSAAFSGANMTTLNANAHSILGY